MFFFNFIYNILNLYNIKIIIRVLIIIYIYNNTLNVNAQLHVIC